VGRSIYPALLQANRAKFNQNDVDPTCRLCAEEPEDRRHFLSSCALTQDLRNEAIQSILQLTAGTPVHESVKTACRSCDGITNLIIDPQRAMDTSELVDDLQNAIERIVTDVCHKMHVRRWSALQ